MHTNFNFPPHYNRYVTLPFEIRSNRFLMMLYNRLSKLQIGNRDMSVKFPQEFLDYIEGKMGQDSFGTVMSKTEKEGI